MKSGPDTVDIIFIRPPIPDCVGLEIPLEILYPATFLERHGFRAAILDLSLRDRPLELLRNTIESKRPRVIGLTAYTTLADQCGRYADWIKEHFAKIIVIMGGMHASAMPEATLALYQNVDYVIVGEGEIPCLNLMKAVISGGNVNQVKSLAWRRGVQVVVNPREAPVNDIDSLPVLNYDLIDLNRYANTTVFGNFVTLPTVNIISARGCPYDCSFCATHHHWGARHRYMSPARIVREMKHCHENHGIRTFRFIDDVFTEPVNRLKQFCELIIKEKLPFFWICYSRMPVIDKNPEILTLMKRAGCYSIKYGLEVGDEEILESVDKRMKLGYIKDVIRKTQAAGIVTKCSVILGFNQSVDRKTIAKVLEIKPDLVYFNVLTRIPGSVDFNNFMKRNGISPYEPWHQSLIDPEVDIKRLKRSSKLAFYRFYLRPAFVWWVFVHFLTGPIKTKYWALAGWQFIYHILNPRRSSYDSLNIHKYKSKSLELPDYNYRRQNYDAKS